MFKSGVPEVYVGFLFLHSLSGEKEMGHFKGDLFWSAIVFF